MRQFNSDRRLIVKTAQKLVEKGYLAATGGNISVRIKKENAFAITPSNRNYMTMTAADICILDEHLNVLSGPWKPSMEAALHGAVYRTRGDVNAVIHTHQVYAGALTIIKTPLPALFDEQVRFLGKTVAGIPYAPPGSVPLKNNVLRHIKNGNNAFLIQNHGALVLGHDMDRAVHNVEILERYSLAYLLAICSGYRVSKIPMRMRETFFKMLRQEQKKLQKDHCGSRKK